MRSLPTQALASATAITTVVGTLLLLGLMPSWPWVAEVLLARHTSMVGYLLADAALCLGPLCVPLLVLVAGLGVHAAWNRKTEAVGLCATALGGWASAATIAVLLVQ